MTIKVSCKLWRNLEESDIHPSRARHATIQHVKIFTYRGLRQWRSTCRAGIEGGPLRSGRRVPNELYA